MQRSPIHIFVVVFDFQVCEIFVINEGKLTKNVEKISLHNMLNS